MEIDGVSYNVWSLSARRAWIEINNSLDSILAGVVALRKESVDRNLYLSAKATPSPPVALRKESMECFSF